LQNFREDETGGRDRERYVDKRVDPCGWMATASCLTEQNYILQQFFSFIQQ